MYSISNKFILDSITSFFQWFELDQQYLRYKCGNYVNIWLMASLSCTHYLDIYVWVESMFKNNTMSKDNDVLMIIH